MSAAKAVVRTKSSNGNPADDLINTLYFSDDVVGVFDPLGLNEALTDLFQGLSAYQSLNSVSDTQQTTYEVFDMGEPEPRVPIASGSIDTSPTNTIALPREVAVCLSFQGEKLSGVNQARRRGRIYIGGLSVGNIGVDGFVSDAMRSGMAALMQDFASYPLDPAHPHDWRFSVYSPTDADFVEITNGWVDNEWDTQRRRGREATARSNWVRT